MSTAMMIEIFGYIGSVLVVVSMLMTSVKRIRIMNSIGAGLFAIYALIIHSYPTALMNGALVAINIFNLIQLARQDSHYDLIDGKKEESFLQYIVSYYKDDIKKYFPQFDESMKEVNAAYIVCTDAVPAGILLGKIVNNDTMEVVLDYSTPTYRDCSVGEYLYSKLPMKGVQKLVYKGSEEKHTSYLSKMGFVLRDGVYVKEL